MYAVFVQNCGSPICHVLLTVENTHWRALLFMDFYTNKTEQHLQTKTYCHLLGLDETSGAVQTWNYFIFFFQLYFSVEIDFGEILERRETFKF